MNLLSFYNSHIHSENENENVDVLSFNEEIIFIFEMKGMFSLGGLGGTEPGGSRM